MDVSYSLTRDDFQNFVHSMQRQTPPLRPRSLVRRVSFFIVPVAVVVLAMASYGSESLSHAGVVVVLAAVAALVIGLPVAWLDSRQGKPKAMKLPPDLSRLIGNHRATVAAEGLRDRCPRYDETVPWRTITRITEDDEYLYFIVDSKGAGLFIPKRDFASPSRARAFLEEAQGLWRAHRLAQPPVRKAL